MDVIGPPDPPTEAHDPAVGFLLVGWVVVLLALPAAAFSGGAALLLGDELSAGARKALLGVSLGVPPLALIALGIAWWRGRR